MTTDTRDLTGARASSLVLCERKAVYEGVDAPRAETDTRMERIFRRGRRIGQVIAEEIAEGMAEEGRAAILEREITWAAGTGHADLFIPDDRHTIEIVSTAGAALPPHKPRQVAFYSMHDPDSDFATVLSIDPSTNEEQAYPIDVETFVPELTAAVERVVHDIRQEGGPRYARRALDARGDQVDSPAGFPCFNCPFREACWADWEPEPAGILPDDLHAVVTELADARDVLGRFKNVPHAEATRDELQARLAGRLKPGVNYRIPGAFSKVRYSPVAGRRTFGLKAFEDAGHVLPEIAEPFVTTGKGHLHWTITREEPGT